MLAPQCFGYYSSVNAIVRESTVKMSLLKYFNKLGTPTKRKAEEQTSVTPKKSKLNHTVSEKNKKYDGQKRERKFQQYWQDTFPWLCV